MRAGRNPPAGRLAVPAALALIALIGLLDAAIGDNWDLVVLFAAIALLAGVGVLRELAGRPRLAIRADLVGWLERRASIHGERTEHVADRAIAAYRAGLLDDDPTERGP